MQYGPCIIWGIDRGFWSKAMGKCLASLHQLGHMCGDPSVPVHKWATYSQCSVLQGEPSSGSAQHLSLMVSASLTTGHQTPSPKACISSGSSIGFLTYVPTKHHGLLLCFSFLKTSLSLSLLLCVVLNIFIYNFYVAFIFIWNRRKWVVVCAFSHLDVEISTCLLWQMSFYL